MRVSLAADEALPVVQAIQAFLVGAGHQVIRGPMEGPWPDVGKWVATSVHDGLADVGVVCCWTGTGVSIAANKVEGIRAALCTDAETARGARRWNDANVLALSMRLTTDALASEIVQAFLATPADPNEQATIALIDQ